MLQVELYDKNIAIVESNTMVIGKQEKYY